MRGALGFNQGNQPQIRIIPADAGSTYMQLSTENGYEDHPRGCGEHSAVTYARRYSLGSSPQMRGARQDVGQILMAAGIIPADAGSTRPG